MRVIHTILAIYEEAAGTGNTPVLFVGMRLQQNFIPVQNSGYL